jgi:hypothetical protein
MTGIQEALSGLLREIAEWRRQRAQEYDRDPRNLVVAAGLDELAAHIRALPPDDARLLALGELLYEHGEFAPGQKAIYEIGRFRFYYPEAAPDPFLDRLVEFAAFDRAEAGHFAGRTPEGDDPWGGSSRSS